MPCLLSVFCFELINRTKTYNNSLNLKDYLYKYTIRFYRDREATYLKNLTTFITSI